MTTSHTAPDRLPLKGNHGYAAYIGISEATAYTWRSRGLGPRTYRVGNKVYADRVDLDAWLNEQKAATASA